MRRMKERGQRVSTLAEVLFIGLGTQCARERPQVKPNLPHPWKRRRRGHGEAIEVLLSRRQQDLPCRADCGVFAGADDSSTVAEIQACGFSPSTTSVATASG